MIRIITDSTCDILKAEQMKMGIEVLPLTVYFGDKGYKDGVELSRKEFYKKLEETSVLPTTSQLNPAEFEEVFQKFIDNGDEIICILVSQELSGTYQSAKIAAEEFPEDKIHIVDSTTVSVGLSLLLTEAVRLRDEGESARSIADKVRNLTSKVRLYGIIDTLKYLKMGGRLSVTSATIGSILGIQPMIEVKDGKVTVVGKVRSFKSGLSKLSEYISENPVNFSYGFGYGHSNCEDKLNRAMEYMREYIKTKDIFSRNIGSVVGTHSGPGVICISYIEI